MVDDVNLPRQASVVDRRVVWLCALAIAIGAVGALTAQALTRLIFLITNLAFFGQASVASASPAQNTLGWWVILVPAIGGIVVGLMARYGSAAIRGHGIPEAMEQVLTNESRIPPRMTFLKPASAAVAIGTGGPFGSEGPIIATGGALGSLVGQVLHTTADERKTLLSAGAAAGMAATFGAPVSAVLLAIELLLFEFRPRSLIPVALAASTAAGMRVAFEGAAPMFAMPDLATPTGFAIGTYIVIGALMGLASVAVTRTVYLVEDLFARLPIHWMWWPALGGMAVGAIGVVAPRTLGVGYSNITDVLGGHFTALSVVFGLCTLKLLSWLIALGSGTSGGTLAPLFTIGSGMGFLLGHGAAWLLPGAAVDPRVAALVGMAAIFAGASRALLASAVFAFETTLQPLGLLPLLGGCSASFLVSSLLMKNSIMTEKIARRGVRVPVEYAPDFLAHIAVHEAMSTEVVTLEAGDTLGRVRDWIAARAARSSHQGFPIVDADGTLIGVLTRRDLLDARHDAERTLASIVHEIPRFVYPDLTLRNAADHMVNHDIGRLPVLERRSHRIVGMLTRSDLISAHRRRLRETWRAERSIRLVRSSR
jgi:H+/Cl- antiporter ClcA/CBS domain-containing protein